MDSDKIGHGRDRRTARMETRDGRGRRRRWSASDKSQILAESFFPGANVSEVARRHGVHANHPIAPLLAWLRTASRPSRHLEQARFDGRVPGGDYEGFVDAHVRRLEALRRAKHHRADRR